MKKNVNKNLSVADTTTIKTIMFTRGITQAEIARHLVTVPQWICDVIAGRKKTGWIQRGIAKILGVKHGRIFFETARPYRKRVKKGNV
jgi:transcriptional regulator